MMLALTLTVSRVFLRVENGHVVVTGAGLFVVGWLLLVAAVLGGVLGHGDGK